MKMQRRHHALTLGIVCLFAINATAYFDPHIGRWANRDPIGEAGGPNLFAFNGNNCAGEIDALGLKTYTLTGALWVGTDLYTEQVYGMGAKNCGCVAVNISEQLRFRTPGWMPAPSIASKAHGPLFGLGSTTTFPLGQFRTRC